MVNDGGWNVNCLFPLNGQSLKMSLKRNMKFKFPAKLTAFARRKPSDPVEAPAAAPIVRPRPKKVSFIAAAEEVLVAANKGSSALISRWQLVLQQANAGK
jgi:hypothetical protein